MKKRLIKLFPLAAAALFLSALPVSAQQARGASNAASKYVISAEAGGVNYISGRVMVAGKAGRSGYLLKGDSVKVGERISTSENGKVEILLNPGSYVRLGGNSSFEFVDTSLENLRLKILRGSAMLEVITSDDFTFAVETPKASFSVVKSGIYRLDVLEDGTGRMEVRKGRALIGEDDDAVVKKGRAATVDGENVDVAKFDRGDRDDLETWSRDRAKELDKINDRLERQSLRNTLINGFGANRWNFYDSFGLWVYDPFWSNYCFLPFGYGWRSPYGYRFGRDIWWFELPRYMYRQPPPVRQPRLGQTQPTGTVNNQAGNGKTDEERQIVPPFQKIDRENNRNTYPGRRVDPTSVDSFPSGTSPPIRPAQTIPETRQPSQPTMRRSKEKEDN